MFLKVGRPAWELNIETERLKDKINNDSDKVRATRSKKKRQLRPNEASKKHYRCREGVPKSFERPTIMAAGILHRTSRGPPGGVWEPRQLRTA